MGILADGLRTACLAIAGMGVVAAPTDLAAGEPGRSVAASVPAVGAIRVLLGFAEIVRVDVPIATVVVGDPAMLDVKVVDGTGLALTGMRAGTTNLIVLDEDGADIARLTVRVTTAPAHFASVYRGVERQVLSCDLACEPVAGVAPQ